MACDAGEDQSHLLVIRVLTSIKVVTPAADPLTPAQKSQFRAEIQGLLDMYDARIVTDQTEIIPYQTQPVVDAWVDAIAHSSVDWPGTDEVN